uniref:Uncharacterized protein n=1 Tax=Meloidogyne floridensis TaxID=298350 RepID=A0A915PC53_9BILA
MKKSLSISLFYFLQFASNVLGKNSIESSLHESIDANEAQVENDSEGDEEKYFSLNLLDNKHFDFASGLEPLSEIILDVSGKLRHRTNIYSKIIKNPDNVPDDHIEKINEYQKKIKSKNKQIKRYEAKKQKNLSKQKEIGDNLRKIYILVKEAYISVQNGTNINEITKSGKRSKRKRQNYRYI